MKRILELSVILSAAIVDSPLTRSRRDYQGRALLQYFLGTVRRDFFRDRLVGPSAEDPPAFYRHVTAALGMLAENQNLPEVDWRNTRPTKVCEALAIQALSDAERKKARSVNWRQLTSRVLPPEVQDFSWKRGWGVLPTGDTLAAWGVTRTARCPQCGQAESVGHALKQCRVATTFWKLLTRTSGIAVDAYTRSCDAFTVFLVCVWECGCYGADAGLQHYTHSRSARCFHSCGTYEHA